MTAARKLEPHAYTPEEGLAMLRALPVCEEPLTDEERAEYERLQADVEKEAPQEREKLRIRREQFRGDFQAEARAWRDGSHPFHPSGQPSE